MVLGEPVGAPTPAVLQLKLVNAVDGQKLVADRAP